MIRVGRSPLGLIVALLSLSAGLADAQSQAMQSIADAKGRFTIDFPVDWHVVRLESGMVAVLGVVVAKDGPNPASVNVVVEELPRAMSSDLYAALSERMLSSVFYNYTMIQQGPATIAGQSAYYRYFTWQPNTGHVLYQVQAYFTVGRRGFVVTGSTFNAPEYTSRYVPVIARIFETFHPVTGARVSHGRAINAEVIL